MGIRSFDSWRLEIGDSGEGRQGNWKVLGLRESGHFGSRRQIRIHILQNAAMEISVGKVMKPDGIMGKRE